MLIRNSGMTMDGISRPLRLIERIRNTPSALLLGCCVLLSGSQLTAQDMLLKEYIYLDGRLLAVERQMVTLAAQQTVRDPDRATKMEFVLYPSPGIRKSILPGISGKRAISGIHDVQSMDALRVAVSPGLWDSDDSRCGLIAGEDYPLRLDVCRWPGNTMGNFTYQNGGSDGGL